MATFNVWTGNAIARQNVWHLTPANPEPGDTFIVTVNGKTVSYTLQDTDTYNATTGWVSAVVTQLVASLSASSIISRPEFDEIEWYAGEDVDGNATHIVALGPNNGAPVTITTSTADSGTFGVAVSVIQEGGANTNEKQQVAFAGSPTGGTFTLTFAGATTGNIAWNASAATVETAFEALASVGAGNGTVSGSAGGPWTVEFTGALAGTDVSPISGNGTNLTGACSISVYTSTQGSATTNEVHSVASTLTGSTPYYIYVPVDLQMYSGSPWTGLPITIYPWYTAATIQSLVDVQCGYGNAVVTGDATAWEVEFTGALAGQTFSLLWAYTADEGLNPTSITIAREQTGAAGGTDEVQVVSIVGQPTGGNFTLTFSGATTANIAYNAAAADVKSALEALATVDLVTVVKTGWSYSVTFETPGDADIPQMTGAGAGLTGGGVLVTTQQVAAAGINEAQLISLSNNPSGGTFTLTFNAETTGNIAYNASAATVQTALEALGTPVPGDLSVTGNAGGPWAVTFTGAYAATNVALMTGDGALLTGTGGQTFTATEITTATGPNWFTEATNWSAGTAPADNETLVFQGSSVSCLYGLSAATITPEKVIIYSSYTGQIGLPKHTGEYSEYRPTELTIGTHGDGASPILTIEIGEGDGTGSDLIRINTGTKQTKLTLWNAGSSAESGAPAVCWRGTHASNELHCYQGSLGIAHFAGHVATVLTLYQGYVDSIEGDSQVFVGWGVTLGTVTKSGGELYLAAGCTSLHNEAGDVSIFGSGAVGVLNSLGGTCYLASSGIVGHYGPIAGITKANPAVVTDVAHGLATGDVVRIGGVVGMTEVNQREFTVHVLTPDTFELVGENSSGYGAWSAGGYWGRIGSVQVAHSGVLDFTRSLDARQVAVAIDVYGDSASVIDSSKRVSTLTYLTGEFAVHWHGTTRNADLGYDCITVRR